MRGLCSIPTDGNILSLEFFCFHAVKTKMPILAFLCVCEKNPNVLAGATIGNRGQPKCMPTVLLQVPKQVAKNVPKLHRYYMYKQRMNLTQHP